MANLGYLYINDVNVLSGKDLIDSSSTYTVTSTGLSFVSTTSSGQWAYSGSGTFAGFSLLSGSTSPDSSFTIGSTGTFPSYSWDASGVHLYSVAGGGGGGTVTDLTGTTWLINLNPYTAPSSSYSINFTSNNQSFTSLSFNTGAVPTSGGVAYTLKYGSTSIYNPDTLQWYTGSSWSSNDSPYRTISITGGTDVTNASLIGWLETNAVQQGSSGYTGTITSSGYNSTVQYVRYPSDSSGTIYYTAGDTISVSSGDSVYFYCNAGPTNNIYLDGTSVGTTSYTWTPDADFEVAFTASIASWGRLDITRVVPSTPGVTITYDGNTISTITQDGTTTLPTSSKCMATDVVVSGTNVSSATITYNGNTIATGTGTFTKTLQCAGKVMATDVTIAVVISSIIYTFENGELTISNAPYEFSGGELTI